MSGLLSNAIAGLQVSQNALRTTGHNISNANTPGYSRQRTEDATRAEQPLGSAGYMGSGVTTQSIERVVDQFVNDQLRSDTTAFHQLDKFNTNIKKIDRLFADESTGLSGGLKRFFAAVQNGADDPSSSPARQLVLTEAESLSNRFNNLQGRLVEIGQNINREVDSVIERVNDLSKNIAELNRSIAEKSGAAGNEPNDSLDKRDEALRELSELVNIQTVTQGGGQVSVFMGQGHTLVVGSSANAFSVNNSGEVNLSQGGRSRDVTSDINGGQLGGLLEFREGPLNLARNDLGRIALALSEEFNQQQEKGLDLDGDYGQRLFKDINDPSFLGQRVEQDRVVGPNDRQLSLEVSDTKALTNSDYRFQIVENTNNYVVTRLSDNETVSQGVVSGANPQAIEFDGLSLNLEGGSFQGGDRFTLKPTASAAQHMEAELSRPEDLAFAAPVRTGSSSGNEGSGSISQGEVLSLTGPDGEVLPAFANPGQLSPPVVIRFTSENTYEVLDNSDPSNPTPLEPPVREQTFVPGRENAIFSNDPGETRIIGDGPRMGLPEGRSAQTLAPSDPALGNGYPVEQMRFSLTDPDTGVRTNRTLALNANASAAQSAEQLSRVSGVSVNAFTQANITDINIDDFSSPLQVTVNGENLLEYQGGNLAGDVPNPQTDEAAFNDYLAQSINGNSNLKSLGFRAESGADANGEPELRIVASSGVDMDIRLEADAGGQNRMSVNDANGNPDVRLEGQGAGSQSAITVGGRLDLTLADGVRLDTAPSDSQLLGDSRDEDFAQSSFLGYQAEIKGQPKAGDTFTLDFNNDASSDNRAALGMAGLERAKVMGDGNLSFGEAYGRLVEEVGTESASARSNTEAARSLMEQTQDMRDSISGVNLDEEAAKMIKFEQAYNANSRVISVARDMFDTLLNSV